MSSRDIKRRSKRPGSAALIRKDLRRRAFRTAAVIGAVGTVVGALFVTMLLSGGATFSAQSVRNKLGADILVVPNDARLSSQPFNTLLYTPGPYYMTAGYEQIVLEVSGVDSATPQLYVTHFYEGWPVFEKAYIVAIDPDNSFLKSWLPHDSEIVLGDNQGVLGWAFPPFKTLPNNGVFYDTQITEVYRLPRTGTFIDRALFVSLPTAQKMMAISNEWQETNYDPGPRQNWLIPVSFQPGQISALLVEVSEGADSQDVANRIQSTYTRVRAMTVNSLVDSAQQRFAELLSTFGLSNALILGSSVVLVAAFTSATTNEKRGEFGVIRAVGATRFYVWRLVAAQTVLVTTAAGAIGITAASIALPMLNSSFLSGLQLPQQALPIQDYLELVAFTLGISALVGMAGAFLPALRASTIEPYESIRRGAR